MIKYDFTQTGGFPLDQDILNDLQNSTLEVRAALANILGPLAIISGCVVAGSSAGDGVVAINGEILPFVGGVIAAKVIVVETTADLTYFDDSPHPSKITRIATFGDDGVQDNPWASFTRNSLWVAGDVKEVDCTLAYIADNFDGTGLGTNERTGWAICNGNNGTKNRNGRVSVQLDLSQTEFNDMGKTGGEKEHTLTEAEMPEHGHTINTSNTTNTGNDNADPVRGTTGGSINTRGQEGTGKTIGLTGGGESHNNLQEYIVTLFIQKV